MVFSIASVEFTPEALLTNLESVPFVRVRNALPPFCFNCLFNAFAIVSAVPFLPDAQTSPNLVTKNTPPSPSNITTPLYFISPASMSSGDVTVVYMLFKNETFSGCVTRPSFISCSILSC